MPERGRLHFFIKVVPTVQRLPAVFVINADESLCKSVLQMAILAAGTQWRHREDMPSCAAIPSDLCSTAHTADPLSFSLYLPLISPVLLNPSVCVCCSYPYTNSPCKPHNKPPPQPGSWLQNSHRDLPHLHSRPPSPLLAGPAATALPFSVGTGTFHTC